MSEIDKVRRELKDATERTKLAERQRDNASVDLQTIDVLINHAILDLREQGASVRVRAALLLCETIQNVTGLYR